MASTANSTRILVVYGTETGTSKAAIARLAKAVAAREGSSCQIVDTLAGNAVGALEGLSDKYDVLLVATSSVRPPQLSDAA